MPLRAARPELVFGLVGPTGVDLGRVCQALTAQLRHVGYDSEVITLSQLIVPFTGASPKRGNEYERIDALMTEGTQLRRSTGQADVVARLGLAELRARRAALTGDADAPSGAGVAYILRSFKRAEEIQLFRDIYGDAFTLISVYAPREVRKNNLARKFQGLHTRDAGPEELAMRLIARDFSEEGPLGQNVSDAFPLADFFVTSGSSNQLESSLRRLVRLVFGDPFISPSKDEQGMFFAQAAALRSLDLSRQVGAAITDTNGAIITTGCNEVPKFGGGLYWEDDEHVARDLELGHDANVKVKTELVTDALARMKHQGWLNPQISDRSPEALAAEALHGPTAFFRQSRLFDVIEFGRAVHAEMAAITQAASEGRRLQGARLYCTTFPCHLCARHIVASGIVEVLFIEPYEKSRTKQLFGDSISVEPLEPSPQRANFRSFVGVAPRRYMEFFAMGHAPRKTKDGDAADIVLAPRLRRFVPGYVFIERQMLGALTYPPPPATARTGA